VKTNPKNAINEHFLPRFLDFIVWGHEHECLVDPQEVPGMGFHITQPGSSVATSLIDGESKPKHVLLLEIKGNQYRPTKIPLTSVRPFEYTEVVLKEESDIDPNDQNSILEHLDSVVRNLIEKSRKKAANGSEFILPLIRIKVDYSGFMTINPQRFGQKYVGKVANPQDILIFSKASKRVKLVVSSFIDLYTFIGPLVTWIDSWDLLISFTFTSNLLIAAKIAKIGDSERLRPEELNQQNIEALVAENNLKMEILPVNDLDVALHNFVNKDDKMAFYSCLLQSFLYFQQNKIARDSDILKFEEEDLILKFSFAFVHMKEINGVGYLLQPDCQERVKERSTRPKDSALFTSDLQSSEDLRSKSGAGAGSTVSFSDDEDATQLSGIKSTARGRRGSSSLSGVASELDKGKTSTRGRGLLDWENEGVQGKGRKRAAPRGRGRGSSQSSKRGKKSENSALHRMLMSKDDDDDDEDNVAKRFNKSQPRVTRNYGALRR
ncbi:hypothetical protein G4B88_015381, partial [Cannabis sativa]